MRKVQLSSSLQRKIIQSNRRYHFRGFKVEARPGGVRYLETDSSVSSNTLPPWTDSLRISSGEKNGAAKDIIFDDLRATIEAHRATNVGKLIHKRPAKNGHNSIRRIDIRQQTADSSNNNASMKVIEPERATNACRNIAKYPDQWDFSYSDIEEPVYSERPWLAFLQEYKGDAQLRLRNEMKAFETYMRPTLTETIATQRLIRRIERMTSAVLPSNPITVFGSRSTGLARPHSDIDFSLALPEYEKDPSTRGPSSTRPEARRAGKRLLRNLYNILRVRENLYHSVILVPAKKPIVTAIDRETGLSLQFITLESGVLSREFTVNYLMEFPGLRPIFILLRHCLEIRNLTTVYHGGLGSYALLIMIVAALKHASGVFASDDLAGQLLHVLDFYSTADLDKNAYSADPPRIFSKNFGSAGLVDPHIRIMYAMIKASRGTCRLCLQDPASPTTDLGANALEIRSIQTIFTEASRHVRTNMKMWESLDSQAQRRWSPGILDPLVRADYEPLEVARRKLGKSGSLKIDV